jgi:iron complex transport system ATP-binding protein
VIARALAQESPILLLDEPTSALDVGRRQEVMELIDRLRLERGLTVVSALHDLTVAGQFTDRLVMMDGGVVVARGSAREVLTPGIIKDHYGANVRVVEEESHRVSVIPTRIGPTGSGVTN